MAQFDSVFEGVAIRGDRLNYKRWSWNVRECSASVDQGAQVAGRITGTRVVTGALLAGPVGAIVGALAKKDRSKVYLVLEVPGDVALVEVAAKHEGKARRFAQMVNRAAQHHDAIEQRRLRALD